MYAFFPLKEKVVLLWHLSPWKPALQVQLALEKKKKKKTKYTKKDEIVGKNEDEGDLIAKSKTRKGTQKKSLEIAGEVLVKTK